MEEATLDHGLDRLPFFLLLFFFPLCSFATTFGPIPLNSQIEAAQYIVHGRIVGSSWVMENRENRRPYTHWKLQVIKQPKGEELGKEVVIRQPGGEIGEMGYHVAGTATFTGGEEVFVNLRDTEDPDTKEVLGMTSGKYTVEKNESGQQVLRSGLGFLLKNENGVPYTTSTFLEFIDRVKEGKQTEADKTILVTKGTQDHGGPAVSVVVQPPGKKGVKSPPEPPLTQPEPQKDPYSIESNSKSAEEPGSSSGFTFWWAVIVLPIFGAFVWFLRRD